ncbi:magnetosome protein MamE-Cter [Candidatus Magnetomorum sp. HK-1]|nr:magnetosome protein MamE-Cter [Candidatus Magnetomorum sp. HK-1]
MNKSLILGPLSVMGFVIVLLIMYTWVGDMPSETLVMNERPEMNLVVGQTPLPPDNANELIPNTTINNAHVVNTHVGPNAGQVIHHTQPFSVGIGSGPNAQMQLIQQTKQFSSGLGTGPNSQMQLIQQNRQFSSGLGTGPNSQMQLIQQNNSFPTGLGNSQIQLVNLHQTSVFLGLDLSEINAALALELKLKPKTGVYVRNVIPKSPAQKAGVKTGDVLLKCDHKPVLAREQVSTILVGKKAGDVIKLLVQRNGHKKSFHIKLAKKPVGLQQAAAKTTPVWLGADIQDIDAIMKMQFKLADKKGVIISHVSPGSPAETSGLKTGDVIRRYKGTRIRNVNQFQSLILKGQPGDQASLSVLRDKRLIAISVVLGQLSPKPKKKPFISPADIAIEGTWIGMDVSELSSNDATALNLPASTRGILVNDVESPPAMTLGFQTGDVLTGINGIHIPDMKAFVAASKHQTGAVVDVIRGNKHFFITVPPPGYTRQGTQLKTGGTQHMKKVALTTPVRNHRIAVMVAQPSLSACVSGNTNGSPFIILVDVNKLAYATLDPIAANQLLSQLQQHQVKVLICSAIDRQTSGMLSNNGISIYSGVVGSAQTAIQMYSASKLISMSR